MAGILDRHAEASKYQSWAKEIKEAFNLNFLDPVTAVYATGSQTAISMPLVVGLVPDSLKQRVQNTLLESIKKSGMALTAGDVGFHFLVRALHQMGADQILYEMNARDDVPGYGYQLKKGATALTESWAALDFVSNNHLMLGHLMDWFYRGLAGIDQTESSVAYLEILIHPRFVKGIDSVKAKFESPHGRVESGWKKNGDQIIVNLEIPVNASAQVEYKLQKGQSLYESGRKIEECPDITEFKKSEQGIILKIGSGEYKFEIK
jgi:hypothetical protein